MKIAILGGSFNPPHWGHLLIAYQVLDFTEIEEIWLTPCFRHTFDKELTPISQRVEMTKMLTNNKIKYCGEEIENRLSGETIELMTLLRQKYPQCQFSFITGSDNLKDFKKWGSWEKLLTTTQFLVFPRSGFKSNLAKYGLDKPEYKLQIISHPLMVTSDVSSSNIRERVRKGLSIDSLVPKKVKEYIEMEGLYRKI